MIKKTKQSFPLIGEATAEGHPCPDFFSLRRRDAARRRRLIHVKVAIATENYENDLKLSIALDRLLQVLDR